VSSSLILGVMVATAHLGPSPIPLQSFTPGIYAIAPSGLSGGFYHNSEGRASAWIGATASRGALSLSIGVVSGYGPLRPLLAASYRFEGTGLRLSLVPHRTAPLTLGVEW